VRKRKRWGRERERERERDKKRGVGADGEFYGLLIESLTHRGMIPALPCPCPCSCCEILANSMKISVFRVKSLLFF